jgi:hypothetical protein
MTSLAEIAETGFRVVASLDNALPHLDARLERLLWTLVDDSLGLFHDGISGQSAISWPAR